MLTSFETDDYMSDNPVCFSQDTDIFEAIDILLKRKVSGGTVLNDNKEVIGVISELDCLRAVIHTSFYHEGGGSVGDFMTRENIEHLELHTSLVDAAQTLLEKKRRRMPIVDKGRFVGQISARSVLQVFKESMLKNDTES